jgi:hypothetical protein
MMIEDTHPSTKWSATLWPERRTSPREAETAPDTPEGPGVVRPSSHDIRGVLKWIEAAQATQRIWARNALVVVLGLFGLLLVALKFGILR